jgi:hypothetical protein
MRAMMVSTILLSFALPIVTLPVQAQTRLPRTSPSERQVNQINRSLQQEQRRLRFEEQYQIDRNQLRQNLDRQRSFSNPSPPARFRTCPAGSVGC